MTTREFFSYCLYFLLCAFLLTTQWFWSFSPRVYLEPLLDPVYDVYEGSVETLGSTVTYFRSRSQLEDRLEALRTENRDLRREVYRGRAALRENQQLREYLNLPTHEQFSVKPAEVIQRNMSGWEQTIRVNQGSNDGIGTDQLVLQVDGDSWIVRGRVYSTTPNHSVIILSSDPRFKVGVRVEGILGRQFVARGWGYRGLRIENFPPFLTVEGSARVFTAPASVIAPRQFYLGRVAGVEQNKENQVGRRIQITPPELTNEGLIWVVISDD